MTIFLKVVIYMISNWPKISVFADTSVGCKILVHVADDEIDTIPDYGEVFSSDEEDDDDPGNYSYFFSDD